MSAGLLATVPFSPGSSVEGGRQVQPLLQPPSRPCPGCLTVRLSLISGTQLSALYLGHKGALSAPQLPTQSLLAALLPSPQPLRPAGSCLSLAWKEGEMRGRDQEKK